MLSEKSPRRRGRPFKLHTVAAAVIAFLERCKPGFHSCRGIAYGIDEPKSNVYDALTLLFRENPGGRVRYFPGKGWYARVHEEDVLRSLEDHPIREDLRVGRNDPQRWGEDPVEEAMLFLTNVQGRPVKIAHLPLDIGIVMYGLQGDFPEPGSARADSARMRLSLGDYEVRKELLRREGLLDPP